MITVTTQCDACKKVIERNRNNTMSGVTIMVFVEPLTTLHFCSWSCLAKYATDQQEPPAEPVGEKESAFPDWTIDGD